MEECEELSIYQFIDELDDSWINGNRSDVMTKILEVGKEAPYTACFISICMSIRCNYFYLAMELAAKDNEDPLLSLI